MAVTYSWSHGLIVWIILMLAVNILIAEKCMKLKKNGQITIDESVHLNCSWTIHTNSEHIKMKVESWQIGNDQLEIVDKGTDTVLFSYTNIDGIFEINAPVSEVVVQFWSIAVTTEHKIIITLDSQTKHFLDKIFSDHRTQIVAIVVIGLCVCVVVIACVSCSVRYRYNKADMFFIDKRQRTRNTDAQYDVIAEDKQAEGPTERIYEEIDVKEMTKKGRGIKKPMSIELQKNATASANTLKHDNAN